MQTDPIRAPARAKDLTLRQRVLAHCAGNLERRYATLPIEEDFFVNCGFLPRDTQALMQPRGVGGVRLYAAFAPRVNSLGSAPTAAPRCTRWWTRWWTRW